MYPNTFYRVSVKAYVVNEQGQIFVVRENDQNGDSWWSLPGGGLDHGELPADCLQREIREELGIDDVRVGELAYTRSFYLDRKDAWLLWIVYRAEINSEDYHYADGVTDARFIDVNELQGSTDMFERAVVELHEALQTTPEANKPESPRQ